MIKPYEWNTVVVGQWNPAILNPKGISEIIFKAPAAPVEVFVPLNAIGPLRVKNEKLFVSASFDRLIIDCVKSDWNSFEASRTAAINAIEELPKTPLIAVGYNIRYQMDKTSDSFIKLISAEIDSKLSDAKFRINAKTLNRQLDWKQGKINFQIQNIEGKYNLLINFDKTSNSSRELINWLKIPINDVKKIVNKILSKTLNISLKEIKND